MKPRWFLYILCLGSAIWLASCTQQTRGGGGGSTYPECDPYYMVEPSLVSPTEGSVVPSLMPMFEWAYPGYYISTEGQQQGKFLCYTPGFHLYLSSGPDFQDELGTVTDGVPAIDSLYTMIWTPETPLEPGTEYQWRIQPISHGEEGPSSTIYDFFTGPQCEAGALVAPIPISPLNHWVVDDLGDLALYWDYPDDCVPDGYAITLSNSLVLDGSPLSTTFDAPFTRYEMGWQLEDCQRYFWRVRAIKDGQEGPGSQLYTFKVDLTGSCLEEATGMIRGTVWEDQCDAPAEGSPLPETPPLGCVYPSPGTIMTNQSYDPGEPGIPGLIVHLGLGACPSSELRDVPTWQDGTFDFYVLSPGTYCVSVDSQNPYNATALIPGQWTYPEEIADNPLISQTVAVSAGQEVAGIDFGWWYDYGTAWGSTNASVFGNVWHDLCAYTAGDPVPNPLPEGCALDPWGIVHADAIRQEGEPGIAGVAVDIGSGDCPSAGLATSLTDDNGYYFFTDLPAGKYCLRIDPEDGGMNQGILMPGSWTYIPSGHEGMTFRAITLTANHTLAGEDFGWDYDNLPAEPEFTLTENAYCRFGPDTNYEAVTSFPAGRSFPITGWSQDGLWYFIQYKETSHCWLPGSSGTASGDPARFSVFYGPPLPEVTEATISCSDYSDSASCLANPSCTWTFGAFGPGSCKSK